MSNYYNIICDFLLRQKEYVDPCDFDQNHPLYDKFVKENFKLKQVQEINHV